MKKLLLSIIPTLVLAVFAACNSEPETPEVQMGSIYGVVTNSKTNNPIQGVSVTLSPSNLTTITGYDGHYEFVDVEAGQYKIFCQADGYSPNYQPITVKAGAASTADILLTPEEATSSFQISTTVLDFGTQYSELALEITNTGTAGNIEWSVGGVSVSWLEITPASGTLGMGKTDVMIAHVNRALITKDEMTYIKITAAGSSKSITVRVKNATTSGGNQDDEPEDEGTHSFELSTTTLDFGKYTDELTLSIKNTGTAGNMTWSVNSFSESWLTVSPMMGSLGMGKSAVMIVKVNRNALTADKTMHLLITSEGSTESVTVQVQKEQTSSGGDGGTTGGGSTGGGTVNEDYSKATVQSCDYRIGVKIVSCKRNATSVLFTYTLTNNSFGDCNDFRIVGPARMGSRTTIYDNEGNQYEYNIMMTFGSKKNGSSHILNGPFLEGVPYKCSFDIPNVPSTATHMSFKIEVEAYAHVNDCGSDFINFLNVPIY